MNALLKFCDTFSTDFDAPISGQALSLGHLMKELLIRGKNVLSGFFLSQYQYGPPSDGGSLWDDEERDLCLNKLFGTLRKVFNCRKRSDSVTLSSLGKSSGSFIHQLSTLNIHSTRIDFTVK